MIFITEFSLRAVGQEMCLLGTVCSIKDFLNGAIDHTYLTQDEYDTGKRALMTNQNWGENETQWEEALEAGDAKLLGLLIKQGKCLEQAVEKSLNPELEHRSNEIHKVLHGYLKSIDDINTIEDIDSIFDILATSGTTYAARCISEFAKPSSKSFKALENSSLEEFILERIALRSENSDFLMQIAKERCGSTPVLTSLLSNSNTPDKAVDILSKDPSTDVLDALIKTNNNSEQHINTLIEDIKSDVFRGIHIKPVLTSVKWIADTLEDNPEKRDSLQYLIDELGKLVIDNPNIAQYYLSKIISNFIRVDDKDITLQLLDNPEKSRFFFLTTNYLELDRYLAAALVSKHPEVLRKVWKVTKTFYEESLTGNDFHNLYPGSELRGIDACALALYHNPNTPKDILDAIDDCKLPMVIFFNHNAGSYDNNTHPYYNLEEAIKAREEYIRSTFT